MRDHVRYWSEWIMRTFTNTLPLLSHTMPRFTYYTTDIWLLWLSCGFLSRIESAIKRKTKLLFFSVTLSYGAFQQVRFCSFVTLKKLECEKVKVFISITSKCEKVKVFISISSKCKKVKVFISISSKCEMFKLTRPFFSTQQVIQRPTQFQFFLEFFFQTQMRILLMPFNLKTNSLKFGFQKVIFLKCLTCSKF